LRRFDTLTGIKSYCGGFPEKSACTNPLNYKTSWIWRGVLSSTKRDSTFIVDGKRINIPGARQHDAANIHSVEFPGLGTLEAIPNGNAAFFTDRMGIADTIVNTGRYSLRWPGWAAIWRPLKDLGFLDETPVPGLGDGTISPMDFMDKFLAPRLVYQDNEKDLVAMLNIADILAADMTPTLKRALKITFTDPWIEVQPCIFTRPDTDFQTLEDVNKKGITVGVLLGSTGETMAKQFLPNAEIKSYKGGGRMVVQALIAGHVDAGVNDDLAVLTVLPDFPPNSVRLLDKRLGQGKDPLAFAVNHESVNLWQWINLYFKTIRADGTYDKNIAYWMEGTDWKKDH
jgi:hypothetical protein